MEKRHLFDVTFRRYTLIGVLNMLVCTGIMYLLYNLMRLESWFCAMVNHALGGVIGYYFNKRYVFRVQRHTPRTLALFVLNLSLCYLLAYGAALPGAARLMAHWPQVWQDNLGMGIGAAVFAALNYFGQRYVVFRRGAHSEEQYETVCQDLS